MISRRLVAGLVAVTLTLAGCSTAVYGPATIDPIVGSALQTPDATSASDAPTTAATGRASSRTTAAPTTTRGIAPETTTPATTTTAPTTTAPTTTAPSSATVPRTTAPSSATVPSSTGPPTPPTSLDVAPLYAGLTAALQRHDRSAFVRFFSGSASIAAGQWWDNLNRIGFDGGAVGPVLDGSASVSTVIPIDATGRGSIDRLRAGVHLTGDRVEADGRQDIPGTEYEWQIGLGTGNRPTVTGWRSVQHAPWDCGCRLAVASDGAAIVVSYPAESAYGRTLLPALGAALAWTAQFDRSAGVGLPPITGAIAFATAQPARMAGWLRIQRADGGPDDAAYWQHPPPAFTYYLRSAGDPLPGRSLGGARLVLGPAINPSATEQLVHELVHYRLSTEATDDGYLTENPWVQEGLAQLVQQIYFGTPADGVATGAWVVGTRHQGAGISPRRLRADFRDQPPTADQLYASAPMDRLFWYQISASVFAYLAVTYGLRTAVDVGVAAHHGRSPFSLVTDPDTKKLVPAQTLRQNWAAWVRSTYG